MARNHGILRRYGDFPAFFVPAEGEVVLAARSLAGPFLRAAVVRVRRASQERTRVDYQLLEGSEHTVSGVPFVKGQMSHCYIHADDRAPLIRRIPGSPMPPSDPTGEPEDDSGETELSA